MSKLVAKGTGASPGIVSGELVLRSEDALERVAAGKSVILVRIETTAEDVPAMRAVAGIVTTRGGITGDAAIVARSLGKPCIAGCPPLRVDYAESVVSVWSQDEDEDDVTLRPGDMITIDGAKGEIYSGSAV
ncbi:MAG: hypothetical protein KC657_08965 [Myxococcales bacterium]|nr:hypothetical protein [Myxococcales bacterium]